MTSAYDKLSESMRRFVWKQGWTALRPVQANAIPEILEADRDVVIAAPTAGGKTEAAFLPILTNLDRTPVPPGTGYSVLAIAPLKALINDQYRRLAAMAAEAGEEVIAWHGDVATSAKRRSLAKPAGILLITPESLEGLMVTRPHELERAIKALRYVVVDELHSFMGSERGVQLQSLLARIEHMAGRTIPRVALSATVADPAAAGAFLRPGRGSWPVAFPSAGGEGHDTRVLVKEFIAGEGDMQYDEATAADIFRNLRGSSNLVFANSRKEAEGMALRLADLSARENVPDEFSLHHGSLAKADREEAELRLKAGDRPSTVICTSTLELGVDIGQVKSIAQLVTADSVSGLRQRLGRSGRRGEPSILRIYSMDEKRDHYRYHLHTNLVQNIAVVSLLAQGRYEVPDAAVPHYSTLIQQILSLTAQYGSFYPADAWRLLCRDGAFRNIPADEFLQILTALREKDVVAPLGDSQVAIGRAGERIIKDPGFYSSFVTLQDLQVVDIASGRAVGAIQYKPYVGEYILLGARRWLVESVDDATGTVGVNAAHTSGKMMFEGFGREVDAIITHRMREIYEGSATYPYLDPATSAPEHLEAAREYYRRTGLDAGGAVAIGNRNLLFTWGGMRLNRTLALMHKAGGNPLPEFDAYAVADVGADLPAALAGADLEALAALVPRHRKQTDKYDYLLPEPLLNRKYAAAHLTGAMP